MSLDFPVNEDRDAIIVNDEMRLLAALRTAVAMSATGAVLVRGSIKESARGPDYYAGWHPDTD